MGVLSLSHFFTSFIYLFLIGFVLLKNPRALPNRVCALIILCLAIWSFGTGFMHNIYTSKDALRLAVNIDSIGWCSFSALALWFFLIFTKKERVLKNKFIYFLIFFPPVFFIYKQWTGFLVADYVREPFGWSYVWSDTFWPYLFYAYYFIFVAFGLYLCLDYKRKTNVLREKKQVNIIFTTTTIPLVLGSATNVLIQELGFHAMPSLAELFTLIWAGGLVYAITKFGLMAITPQAAADNILAIMGDSLILIDPDGRIITVNPATLDLLGYNKGELIGKPITNILPEDGYARRSEQLIQEGKIRDYDTLYRTSAGDEIPVSLFMSLLKDKQEELVGVVCIAKDMRQIKRLMQKEKELAAAAATAAAEKKRAAELERAYKDLGDTLKELRKTQAQLIQAGKMSAVGQLGAGVAHELNNPLSGILGYAQFMLEKLKMPEFQANDLKSCQKYVESIERESNRCKKIVENLLKFSRKPLSDRPEPLYIATIIEETVSIIGHQLKLKNIEVAVDIKPDLAKVMGVANQFHQVFTNLCLNAEQAMPDGGKIKISVENIMDEVTRFPTKIRIEFTDTGCGIPEENLSRIFEPFFTTKAKEKKMGLGLSVSYQIIQEHKGSIEAKSQVGRGTTIIITLPAVE